MATRKVQKKEGTALAVTEFVEQKIVVVRGHNVMLDADLAQMYGVTTKRLNEQVKRNRQRFPESFMFQLTKKESDELNRSQIATGSQKHRDPRFRPFVFTEHGAVMLASVLNSPIAIEASIQVVKAFVRLRTVLANHQELARQLEKLEQKFEEHDEQFKVVFAALRQLIKQPSEPRRQIVLEAIRNRGQVLPSTKGLTGLRIWSKSFKQP
ncbi:MAG TPA: ORF6N domain-containing protein [Pyrinomonadaceae bacterium]|jgi:hypothetical protein